MLFRILGGSEAISRGDGTTDSVKRTQCSPVAACSITMLMPSAYSGSGVDFNSWNAGMPTRVTKSSHALCASASGAALLESRGALGLKKAPSARFQSFTFVPSSCSSSDWVGRRLASNPSPAYVGGVELVRIPSLPRHLGISRDEVRIAHPNICL